MEGSSTILTAQDLLEKYNVPAPRYTSYPTVPFWQQKPPAEQDWFQVVDACLKESDEISVYIHLPFCERLCTYCGCNTKITQKHAVELPYIETLLKEWQLYTKRFLKKPILKELHLGGGTPTFFSPENLKVLLNQILATVEVPENHDFGFEAHPNSTSKEHLTVLKALGFNRISVGVQDFNPRILQVINRIQTEEQIEFVTQQARKLGYESVNYDIIYGLPLQKVEDIQCSIEKIKTLKPDRIAFYSYAHVPWVKKGQRAYAESDLPSPQEKRELYEFGKKALIAMGYQEIGLDHFALPTDSLYQATQSKELHRNFMGYTPLKSNLLIGLGASAISEAGRAYIQNEKQVSAYQAAIGNEQLSIFRGHLLTDEDYFIKNAIASIMCHKQLEWKIIPDNYEQEVRTLLQEMEQDGIIQMDERQLIVTEKGFPFLRNISMAFDWRLKRKNTSEQLFSKAI
ncbi:MAG: oxygen-independent coproporphyrinogen III oxidase [Flammeovirgaceae bacterium]